MIKSRVVQWGLQRGKGRFIFFICSMLTLLVCSSAGAFKLPDTGQVKCYQAVSPWAEIPCPAPGEPLAQDGSYTINPLSYSDNGNGTVTDNNTGLMWQKEDDGNDYNWYKASGTYEATYNPTSQDVCGTLNLGDHSDWRLPTNKELMTIVDYSILYPGPTIDTTYFSNTKSADYWLSTTYACGPDDAWSVPFYYGFVWNSYKYSNFYVRCVRGEQFPTQSLMDNGDGTVTDNATGLIWQQGEPGYMNWDSALSYCEGLSLGGHSDWRLPNIKELESITDDTRCIPAIDTAYFPNARPTSPYWSSTSDASTTSGTSSPYFAWFVSFGAGHVLFHQVGYNDCIRCVRGQSGSFCDLVVDPTPYNFGNVFVGSTSAPRTVTIYNVGSANLMISSIETTGTNAEMFSVSTGGPNPCTSLTPTIAPGGNCTVTVTFSPTSTLQKTAALSIYSDDPDENPVSVSLTGNGFVPFTKITLLVPNGGEVIPSGSTYTIKWSAPANAVKFDLRYSLNNGTTWITIANKVAGTSCNTDKKCYNWRVPKPLNNNRTCLVKVIGFKSSGVKVGEDRSNSTFTIEVVKLISPDGGETLKSGSTHTITWRTNRTIRPVVSTKLFRTINGGSTWTLMRTLTGNPNPNSYNWTVPNLSSSNCRVKVILLDSLGRIIGSDVSDKVFTIQPMNDGSGGCTACH